MMRIKSLRYQYDRTDKHRPSPELRQHIALNFDMANVLRILWAREGRNHFCQRNSIGEPSFLTLTLLPSSTNSPASRSNVAPRPGPLQLNRFAITAMKSLVFIQHRLHIIFTRGTSFRLRIGYPQALVSTVAAESGFHPSTVNPKTICDEECRQSDFAAHRLRSVESTSSNLPSSGSVLIDLGK